MSNEKNVQEIVAELDKIASLCDQIEEIDEKIDHLVSVEHSEEMDEAAQRSLDFLMDYQESQKKTLIDVAAKLPQNFPTVPPQKAVRPDSLWMPQIVFGIISLFLICLSIAVVGITIWGPGQNEMFCAVLVGITILINRSRVLKTIYDYMEAYRSLDGYDMRVKSWEKDFDAHFTAEVNESKYNAFRAYDERFLSYVEICDKKFEEENTRYQEELEKITEKYQKKLSNFGQHRAALCEELTSTTLIPEELYSEARRISSMLKLKRADSLKEAINLALDEIRKDEEEATRQKEAARQEAILERQALDNERHNMEMQRVAEEEARATREHNAAMERATREHNAAMERAAQDQAKATEAQVRLAQKQAQDAERGAHERCMRCANGIGCSVKFGKGAIGCPSYRPR